MGCPALLQVIFPTQESNLCLLRLLYCRRILDPPSKEVRGSLMHVSCFCAVLSRAGLCELMDCSLPSSSVCGILQAIVQVGCLALLQGIFPAQGWSPCPLCLLL